MIELRIRKKTLESLQQESDPMSKKSIDKEKTTQKESRIRKVICDVSKMSDAPSKDTGPSPSKEAVVESETPIQQQGRGRYYLNAYLVVPSNIDISITVSTS